MIGFHGGTVLPDINGIQNLLNAMQKSTGLPLEQWRNQGDICGCHLRIDDFDERCKPKSPFSLPRTATEILCRNIPTTVVESVTDRLRNG